MARKDISDELICLAYTEYHERMLGGLYPYQALAEWTGEHEKVCWRACERAERHGLLITGVSLRSAWLTDKGKELLQNKIRSDNKSFETIPMGKSPIEDSLEWLVLDAHLVKKIALMFHVPIELLYPSKGD